MLKIRDVKKSFDGNIILNNLNLEIEKGSVFGLVGINGAGKSTLLRAISGVYRLEEGSIEFDGYDTYANPEIRREIMFVSDELYYPFASTIKSLKDFYSSFYHLSESLYEKYLNLFHLDENKNINTFSKGMKRQTTLLFALAIRPKLLLLDEAFDGLDPLVRYNFKKALAELIEDEEITVIISSHNLKELEDICDSFGILEDGRIDTYGDLLETKEEINKYQLAFNEDKNEADFKEFELMHYQKIGKVITLVIKGDQNEVKEKLLKMNPLLLDVLSVNFEELFIYEIERRGRLNA